ncbi:MAG: protein kinase [Planctomycetes bacterium]|nr:protein kinase [Planctomycetota bacterium]
MAKVKLIESTEKFVEVLERSQLFAASQLDAIKKLGETAEDPLPIARTLVKKGWLTKWQASQLLSGFYNLTLGKYRLADHLGKGELGNVYLAENPKLGRKVALKTLSKKHTDSPDLVKRFLGEASAAAALDHRNIVHIHDVSSEGQRHYVVMEYVSGKDLQQRVDADGQLSFTDAASFIKQAAEGLQYAHEQSVIHRDIKPANIMVGDQGIAKILDIGVGHLRQTESNPSDNTGEMMLSAIAYMAPEHARGQEVDERCDVYSLGGVLYFLLTARAPFSAKTDAERAAIKDSKRPVPIADLRADAPSDFVSLCERMMSLKPADRFASMADVLAALASIDVQAAVDPSSSNDADVDDLEPVEVDMDETKVEAIEESADSQESERGPKGASPAIKIDLGDSSKPVAAGAPASFSINTKKRKKKKPAAKPAAAAKAEAETPAEEKEPDAIAAAEPVATVEETEPVEETGPDEATEASSTASDQPTPASTEVKKGPPLALIIGGVCAAALLLVVGGGVGAMLLFGGGDKEVTQATAVAPVSAEPAPDSEGGSDDTTDPFESEAVSSDEASDEPADDVATETSTSEVPATVAGDATKPSDTTGEVAAVESTGSEEPPASDPADPGDATSAPTAESTTEEPMPEPAAPVEPPAEKPQPEPKPEPKKKPPEKKAPPKPKTFVFKPAVDLPTPEADTPELILGQVNIRPEDAVFISLDGGDIAASGRNEFSLQNAQDGVAPRDWEFYLTDGNTDPIVIATMSMPEKELKFKWTSAGVETSTATNLRNCSIRITAGQDKPQDLALRIPQKVAPISINVEKSATAKLPLEGAPDRSSLKMEVTVKGHKSMVEPAQIELGKGGSATIFFGENREQAALALKLDVSLNARGVQIKTDPNFIVPGSTSLVRLSKGTIKKYESAQADLAGLQNQVFQGEKAVKAPKLPPQQKQRMMGALAQIKQQLELVNKIVEKVAQLKTDMAAVGAGASLHVRVYSDTFEKQIDLIVTDPNVVPVAP